MAIKRMADGLLLGLQQAVDMKSEKIKGRETLKVLSRPAPKWTKTKIKKLRTEIFGMSQPIFASLLNVKTATVRAWEQGQRVPDGAASRLLEILALDSDIANKLAS
jgi:putative transcriptional regulator